MFRTRHVCKRVASLLCRLSCEVFQSVKLSRNPGVGAVAWQYLTSFGHTWVSDSHESSCRIPLKIAGISGGIVSLCKSVILLHLRTSSRTAIP